MPSHVLLFKAQPQTLQQAPLELCLPLASTIDGLEALPILKLLHAMQHDPDVSACQVAYMKPIHLGRPTPRPV